MAKSMHVSGSIAKPLTLSDTKHQLDLALKLIEQLREALNTSANDDELVDTAKRARNAEIQMTILRRVIKDMLE